MHRSLQLQLLSWLAGMALVGAIARPSVDAGLFAAAFVLGVSLLRVRESWRWAELVEGRRAGADRSSAPGVRDRRVLGDLIGACVAWGAVVARAKLPHLGVLPERLDAPTLAIAAAVPSTVLVLRVANAIRRRARLRRLDVDG